MKVISTEVTTVTPAKASEWTGYVDFGQRNLSLSRVRNYAEMMRRDQWVGGDGLIVIGHVRDSAYLIAGQHRLQAVIQAGVGVPMMVTHREYESIDELRSDYAATNAGKSLSTTQALSAMETALSMGIRASDLQQVVGAVTLISNDFTTKNRGRAAEISAAGALHSVLLGLETPVRAYINAVDRCFSKERPWFMRSPVAAVGIITFRHATAEAQEFWERAADNDGLEKSSPQSILRRYISTTTVAQVGQSDYARNVALTWSAFYENRGMARRGGTRPGSTIHIAGTPFARTDREGGHKGTGLSILGAK